MNYIVVRLIGSSTIGTAGLGAGSVELLASANASHIFFSGRNVQRANELIQRLKKSSATTQLTFIQCDLASLESVQKAANQFLSQSDRLDILMCNAGIMALPPGITKDGYEIQFGTNHLGHALLIKLLLPILERTADQPNSDVRIINMSSIGYKQAPKNGIDFTTLKSSQPTLGSFPPGHRWSRYGQSKLANLLYTKALACRHTKITSIAIHPGFVRTDLFANVPTLTRLPVEIMVGNKWTPVEHGPYAQTWAATTARRNLESGAYYEPIGKKTKPTTKQANDEKLVEDLWEWTQKELQHFV